MRREANVLARKGKKTARRGADIDQPPANRNIKDGVFRLLFAEKENAAELYHALTGIKCVPDEVQTMTIATVVSGKMKNDLAFVVRGRAMVIAEHMSSPLLNMPVRFLMYAGALCEKWLKMNSEYDFLFGSKLCRIPTPEFVIFYNGTDKKPERETLRLSSAFEAASDASFGSVELEVPVYNINAGMNAELLGKSEKLRHYAEFIAKKREYMEHHADYGLAVRKAVDYCIRNGILAEFLKEHGGRVVSILAANFRMADAAKVWKKEGIEEGIEVGRVEGIKVGRVEERLEIARRMLAMNIAVQDVAKATGISSEQVIALAVQRRP